MGYRRGYDCDVCGYVHEDESHFIGLSLGGNQAKKFVVDSADFHVCLRCARVITDALHARGRVSDKEVSP